jgi:hypothetical protein
MTGNFAGGQTALKSATDCSLPKSTIIGSNGIPFS